MATVSFVGVIQNTTPLHISSIQEDRYAGFPLRRTKSMWFPMFDDDDGTMSFVRVPVITSNTLRGALRRTSSSIIEDVLLEKGERISVYAYQGLRNGAPVRAPEMSLKGRFEMMKRIASHIHMGIFGGGSKMAQGKLSVHNCIPVVDALKHVLPVEVKNLFQPVALKADTKLSQFFFIDHIVRKDDIATIPPELAERVESLIESGIGEILSRKDVKEKREEEVKKQQSAVKQQSDQDDELDENGNGGKNHVDVTRASISCIEFVTPGVIFSFIARLRNPTDAQIGMFYLTLKKFFTEIGMIGGRGAVGAGTLKCLKMSLMIGDSHVGEVCTTVDHIARWDDDIVINHIDAAKGEMSKVSAQSIEEVILA